MVITCETAEVCQQIATAQRALVVQAIEISIYAVVTGQVGYVVWSRFQRRDEET